MKDPTNLIEFRKRRIQSGKNARLYGSILYIATVIIYFIIEDVELAVAQEVGFRVQDTYLCFEL